MKVLLRNISIKVAGFMTSFQLQSKQKVFIDEMPGREVWDENFCYICLESFKFYNCLDKYFHFLRHYNENSLKVFILKLLLNHSVASKQSQYCSVVLIS